MGSGKSFILLLEPLRYINDPDFRGVIFRRLTGDLTKPGGLWDEAKDLWGPLGCTFKETSLTAIFPSGAKIKFSHMEREDDKKSWQGSQMTFIGFDEVAHFSESQVIYMISRLRSKSKVKPYMRMTCNPEYSDHWLYKFVKPYLNLSTGIPDRPKSGVVNYLLNLDGTVHLSEDRGELVKQFGANIKPKKFTFIAGNCYDNQILLKNNPDYISNLEALGRVERERLLLGSWHAALAGAGYFQRSNCGEPVSPLTVPRRIKSVRAWDLAVTEPSEVNPNPDYTAGVKMSLCEDGFYYVEHCTDFRHNPHLVQKKILDTCKIDGSKCVVSLPLDPGAQGKIAFLTWSRPIIMSGYKVKKAATRKGKLERFMGFANACENGLVKVVKGDWNDAFFSQLEMFDGSGKTSDDKVDGCSDAYNWLVTGKKLPSSFSLGASSLTKLNDFSGKF